MMGSTQQIMVNHLQLQTNLYSHPRSYSYSPFANPAGDSMKKAGQIGLGILFSGIAFTSLALYVNANIPPKPVVFSALEGRAWVDECLKLHPEVKWLAEGHVRKTEEGRATAHGAYSEQLFGKKEIEFDRTIMTIEFLRHVLRGTYKDYEVLTAAQPRDIRLSFESFLTLHQEGKRLLKSKWNGLSEVQMAEAMETALVLGDIGKSEKARELFKPYGINQPDHDDFYGEAIQIIKEHPELSPSFSHLPRAAKRLLCEIANLAHYGHVTHLEGGPGMFNKLKKSGLPSKDPIALSVDLFVHGCDVGGALGHVDNRSSLVYTEPAHKAMQAMGDAVRVLSDPQTTEWDAYNSYLGVRASWLGLSSEDRSDRVLVRIGAMLRLSTPEEGAILRNAMLELNGNMRDRIAAALDIQQDDQPSRTPTYMPAVLVNLSNNPELGDSKEIRLSNAIKIGLPFIARVLENHKELLARGEFNPNIPLNFNRIAGIAKTSPHSLDKAFSIDEEGMIDLINI